MSIKKAIRPILLFLSISVLSSDECQDGYIPNCNPDYEGDNVQDCCSETWVGDGYGDCEEQQWGCDLTCYDKDDNGIIIEGEGGNDGGDCIAEQIHVEFRNINPTAINDSIGFVKVSLTTNIRVYHSQLQIDNINIIDAYYNHSETDTIHLNVTDSTIFSNGFQTIEIGESILTIIIKDFDLSNSVCINSSNSYMKDASNNAYSVSWGECYFIVLGCMDINACNFNEFANHHQQSSCIYLRDCNGVCGGELLNTGVHECQGIPAEFDADEEQCGANGGFWVQIGNDACGVCGGDNTSCIDCAGVTYGDSWISECGCVDATSSGIECFDCAGVPNGMAILDECGVCGGDNSTCTDCNDDVNGNAFIDGCGYCVGGNTGLNACTVFTDCAGTVNGNAIIDPCGACVSLGATSTCIQGCDGEWKDDGSQLVNDECGICGGDNSSCKDCANIPNGSNFTDDCGVCVPEGDGSCIKGCDGNWENDGTQTVEDECGMCGGDNSSCQGCTTSNACNYSSTAIIDDGSCTFPQGCNDWCEGDIESLKEIDCNGVCGGGAEFDVCGVCDGTTQDINNCESTCSEGEVVDCAGICGGNATLDNCGVCNGDGSTCLCIQDTTINGSEYCKMDIEILQQFINNASRFGSNQDHTLNLDLDDNENGLIEVLELGTIEWSTDGENRIEYWNCENCGLMGEIPIDINKLKYLRYLNISNNNLIGSIPSTLGSMVNLGVLDLSENHFSQLPNSIVNRLRSLYSNNSNNASDILEYVTQALNQNALCTPLSKTIKEYLELDVNTDFNLDNQSCNPEIVVLYPQDGTIRYTDDTAIPIEVLVTNFNVGERDDGADGHIHYIVDGEISEYPNDNSGIQKGLSFGVWGHSFNGHNMKLWLVDNNHQPVVQNGNYYEAEINYTISPGQSGCMDISACNFNVLANDDDGSCSYPVNECCLDECGECDGDNSTCTDDCGIPNGDNSTCADECGIPNGDNSCIPQIIDISISPNSILPINTKSIEIKFSTEIDVLSAEGVSVSSSHGDGFSVDVGNNGDNKIILISFNELTSSATINIDIDASRISSGGTGFEMNQVYTDSSWTYNIAYLGDYNNSGYNVGEQVIDSDDIDTLITYWGTSNYHYGLGPCKDWEPCKIGDVPYLQPVFDEEWDIEDIMAFVLMWNWSSDNMGRVKKQMDEFGMPPVLEIVDNQIVMNVSGYGESISHIWIEVNAENSLQLFETSIYGNQFDLALNRDYDDGQIKEINLINLQGGIDYSEVILGNFGAQSKEEQKLEIQYKISTKNGILSSGSQMLTFSPIPIDFELSPAYPNPFNPITTINYALPVESNIVLSVYDIQGRLVTNLENELKSAGYYKAVWDASNHASGQYFIRLNGYNADHRIQFSKFQNILLVK